MKTVQLEAYRDDSTGELGLGIIGVPRDADTNSAQDGLLIAHDIIEHVNGFERIGSIDDELEALGAIWYVRGQHGELRRDGIGSAHSIERNIAGDITRMFRDYVHGAYVAPATFRPRGGRVTHQEEIACTIACAADEWRHEIDQEDMSKARTLWEAYADIAMRRMQTGYTKARRRWEPRGRYAANSQFWAITDAVHPYCRHVAYEGARYVLRYGSGAATCEEDYSE